MRLPSALFEASFESEGSCRLDPRSKLLGLILFNAIALFIVSLHLLFLCLLVLAVTLMRLKWDVFRFTRAGLMLSLAFLAGGFLFLFLFLFGRFQSPYCLELLAAIRAILRLIILATSGLLFMFTTSVSRFISSLEKMRLPFPLIFVLTVAIRFFPQCLREMEMIRDNARSRGVWGWQLILHPYRSCRALLFPLLVRSLKKADALALAATIRGFGGPVQRSSIRQTCFQREDFLFLVSLLFISLSLLWVVQWLMVRWGIRGW